VKAEYKGKIRKVNREDHLVELKIRMAGAVPAMKTSESKQTDGHMTVTFKPLVADEFKIGQTLYITLSTEEP